MSRDNHASYAKIGFVVFAGLIAIFAALVYLGGIRGRGGELLVETCYDQPVSGLSVGSAVNFRGVKVGEVREISFIGDKYDVGNARDGARIYILMALDQRLFGIDDMTESAGRAFLQMMVEKNGLRATVSSSGITGLSRIECDVNLDDVPSPPAISWTPRHPYIPAKISLLENFSVAATKVMNQINRMDLNAAWSNISISVESLAAATDSAKTMLQTRQGDVDRILDDLSETSVSLKGLSAELKRNPSLIIRERTPARLEETE